jgi:hypothetical protein
MFLHYIRRSNGRPVRLTPEVHEALGGRRRPR